MYTMEYDVQSGNWIILDPDGQPIGSAVFDEQDAQIMLSHLNRG